MESKQPHTQQHSETHSHHFNHQSQQGERRTLYVLLLTAVTMIVEIAAGQITGSMALLADGWHMATHVAAFAITLFAYRYARLNQDNPRYSFGTGKVNVLGGFASAVALAVVALMMGMESIQRLFVPHDIHFSEAIAVAVLGLLINLISAVLLKDEHHHEHEHDHNRHAAYMHVLADALTSLFAIAALVAAKLAGWLWLDPVVGIVGALIISRWAYKLMLQSAPILLDATDNKNIKNSIVKRLELAPDSYISDLHLWRISGSDYAAIIAITSNKPEKTAGFYKQQLANIEQLKHITVEINISDMD
ncbi:CDF family Co(II)/Ni(II) efflux transporter DmeF [Agaribacterium haliotis]|uniref:CDF family Co(II)/Ni(II) efflux transporter DmeF n=1 Tax=Agaribacterium haliotis TaxID=2013869 RepID=UPI000BB53229|nr:CDF family Co(II)/Ni(II) efflux transporter DmeF [Agaribacterium haliotis]